MKKRYLYFPTYKSDWDLTSPQYVICGDPSRLAFLNPATNATSILWEQIEPNPLTNPVVITPNNTSKNITVNIPVGITTSVLLRVTLDGDTANPRFVTINPLLIDNLTNFAKGSHLVTHDNTLNNPIPYIFIPIVSDGPQAIFFTSSSQQTGVRFLSQSYRNTFTESTTINSIQTVSNIVDNRIKLNINTPYSLLKRWADIKVLSQSINPVNTSIDLTLPALIADEIIYNPFNKGTAIVSSTRTPYLVDTYNLLENLTNNFSKGSAIVSSTRTPYLVDTYNPSEDIINNFNKGSAIVRTIRTPYTSNIVG